MGKTGTTPCTEAQKQLAEKSVRLAHYMARRLKEYEGGGKFTPDEILSECYLALVLAARGYDPSLGFTFSTYACASMRFGVRKAAAAAKRRRERPPRFYSLDAMLFKKSMADSRYAEFESPSRFADPEDRREPRPDRRLELEEEWGWVFRQLNPQWGACLLQYAAGVPMEQVGRSLGVSRERVRQVVALVGVRLLRRITADKNRGSDWSI